MVASSELLKSPDDRILATGRRIFAEIQREQPSLFNKGRWMGKVMDRAMTHEQFKVQLLRFVDVFPSLRTNEALMRHLEEYFGGENSGGVPAVMRLGMKGAGLGGWIGAAMLGKGIGANIREMGRQFIIGETAAEAIRNAAALRRDGFGLVVDLLGEAAVSETEAEAFQRAYLDLANQLAESADRWPVLREAGGTGANGTGLDWGVAPRLQISVKPSALCSRLRAADFEGSVKTLLARLLPVYRRVIEAGGALALDMESHQHKDIILEVFRRLRAHADCRHWPHLGVVLQAYLRETAADLESLLSWARRESLPVQIRLVKGAYWDYETVIARQNGWPLPVFEHKWETDAAFEAVARRILENHDIAFLACASHNVRSIAAVLEWAKTLGVPASRYEFQVLYGMAEPVRKALRNLTGRVRLYCPYGELIPGMAYLVRRLLENTANESFLRQTFVEGEAVERLLANPSNPASLVSSKAAGPGRQKSPAAPLPSWRRGGGGLASPVPDRRSPGREGRVPPDVAEPAEVEPEIRLEATGIPSFANHPTVDFVKESERLAFPAAIAAIRRGQLGKTYPLQLGGEAVYTEDRLLSKNPNQFSEVLGEVCQAGVPETGLAVTAASKAFPAWRDVAPPERAKVLFAAADILRRRIHELSAWQVLEVGKQWGQAHADVSEAIDFLEYYGREMIRLSQDRRMGCVPGEDNRLFYEPRGVAAVIAPWNFPLAISAGMVSAALVAGNCVVYKPSGLSSIIGHQLVEVFREAGLPAGVFNYLPGRSSVMGDHLVEHPDVSLIAFTGSLEVGKRIYHNAAVVQSGQRHLKRVICELGGKNAIIIDDDADLDEAVPQVLYSAFGYQGQKCSACSRVIVLDSVHDRFVERLVEAVRSMRLGPAEDPANDMGAVIDEKALKTVLEYARLATKEGRLLYESGTPEGGWFAPISIVGDIRPEHRIAQEEVFGPVLAVMRARDFAEALAWANATPFALTGAVFSRSPRHLEEARREFRVGNLYLNRGCTGALVERQPFGGSRMSGVGSKAGGPDYLLQFMDPRVVTENTMRRGFVSGRLASPEATAAPAGGTS